MMWCSNIFAAILTIATKNKFPFEAEFRTNVEISTYADMEVELCISRGLVNSGLTQMISLHE